MPDGLTSAQAQAALSKFGPNLIDQKEPVSPLRVLLDQFLSPLIIVLSIASLGTVLIGDFLDAGVIFLAVLVNTFLGFFQEYKAQNALRALSKVLSPDASVWRDGQVVNLPVAEIVPGDLVVIEAGEQIPADGVFIQAKELLVNESILTGESSAVTKIVAEHQTDDFLPGPQDAQAEHYAYMGTTCLNGTGTFRVLATGRKTQVGNIARELSETKEGQTPLQEKLSSLSKRLTLFIICLSLGVFVFGILTGQTPLEMLLLSVAIAVSAIPEGLAISLTMILAIGMQRILKRKALVRKLVAAETLGEITMICTDKTGTLTKGELTVFSVQSQQKELMKIAGQLLTSPSDSLEIALRNWVKAQGQTEEVDLVDEIPFSAHRKFTVKLTADHAFLLGAPEVVLKHCSSIEQKEQLEKTMLTYAKRGYRLLGVAHRKAKPNESVVDPHLLDQFEWTGFVVFSDPVRRDVADAFKKLQQAGIKVKVITGDHAETAKAVLNEIGLEITNDQIMLGQEFKTLSLSQLNQRIEKAVLFARSTPDQKLVIVKTLQSFHEVVAMTGDGVNDAPALKQADIGIVVSNASDVSKETADMVLLDDNFATVVAAVEEGRSMFENLQKVILYLLANAFAETVVIILSLLFKLPLPLTAIQILWVNLATDSLPSMALTIDTKEKNLLQRKPRSHHAPLIGKRMLAMMAMISGLISLNIIFVFAAFYKDFSLDQSRTFAFTLLGFLSLCYVFSARNLRKTIWEEGVFKNKWLIGAVGVGVFLQLAVVYVPFLQRIFSTVALGGFEWMIILISMVVLVLLIELGKLIINRVTIKP